MTKFVIIKSYNGTKTEEYLMQKIVFENETYYVNKGHVYDESFIEVPLSIATKIMDLYFDGIDYNLFEEEELISHIKELKEAKKFGRCLSAIDFGTRKFTASRNFYVMVFPMITSCYRELGQAKEAINFWMTNKEIFSSCLSVPLLTSLAAAYCDVGDYEMAKRCANRAYAMQGGGKNYATELSLVYARIKKETNDRDRKK